MARQHDIIINRLLANYLDRELDPEALEYGGSDITKVFGVMGIGKQDREAVIKAANKRLKQLERISKPLGPAVRDWYDQLVGESDDG